MNILQPFSQGATYAERRRPTVIILGLVMILTSIISISTAAGYLEIIMKNYIPATAAVILAVAAATLFDFCKMYFLQVTSFEAFKFKYLDLITALLFAAFFSLSLFSSLKGIDAKSAAAELEAPGSYERQQPSPGIKPRRRPTGPNYASKKKVL